MTGRGRGTGQAPPLVVLAAGRATRFGGVKPLAPVGVSGQAVLDVLASDALAAGFTTFVLVIGSDTGAAIRYHVAHAWPREIDVRFAHQTDPRGTVDAVRAAESELDPTDFFAVANADDLPGTDAFGLLVSHLSGSSPTDALVTFRLSDTVVDTSPVTRGLCTVRDDGALVAIDERRHVTRYPEGRFVALDGHEPVELDPDQPVSMNLWGFSPAMHELFAVAMEHAGDGEVLLPDVVHRMLADADRRGESAAGIDTLRAQGRCIGVTHATDVPLVSAALAREVGFGTRPAALWSALSAGRVPSLVR